MVMSIEDTKRKAIATKLADMKAIQTLIIANEQRFTTTITNSEIVGRFRSMLEDDRKNLGVLDTVMVQYGVQAEPAQKIIEMVDKLEQLMSGSELSDYEKVFQHELLKHQQAMAGILIHKCAQRIGADVEAAITPLNTVNFENRAHQEQLKGILEQLGVYELTGMEADQSLWGRVQDAIAALSGVAGSVVTQASGKSDMNLQDVIRMDHQKVNVLIAEIELTQDASKRQEYFGQLYQDLIAHSGAEEAIAYPAVKGKYPESDLQELYTEQERWQPMLEQMRSMNPMTEEFMRILRQMRDEIMDHVRQEESTFFTALSDAYSSSELETLATRFKAKKSEVQSKLAAMNNN